MFVGRPVGIATPPTPPPPPHFLVFGIICPTFDLKIGFSSLMFKPWSCFQFFIRPENLKNRTKIRPLFSKLADQNQTNFQQFSRNIRPSQNKSDQNRTKIWVGNYNYQINLNRMQFQIKTSRIQWRTFRYLYMEYLTITFSYFMYYEHVQDIKTAQFTMRETNAEKFEQH